MGVPGFGLRAARAYVPAHAGSLRGGGGSALYLLDGQNVFEDAPSFAGGWHAHGAVERLGPRRHHVPVIVSLANGGLSRFDEMTPWPDGDRGGRAEDFLGWMAEVFVPRMQRRFGLRPGPEHALIGGSSLGGLAALYAHHRWPSVFGGALCMSPSLFWAGGRIFPWLLDQPRPQTSRLYLDCGAKEAGGRMLSLTQALGALLTRRGYGPSDLLVVADARGKHHESAWGRRLPRALRHLLRR